MITQIFNQNSIKVLTLFSLSPGSRFNRKDIQEKTQINNVPLDRTLTQLINTNILLRNKNLYSLNFESEYTKSLLEIIQKEFKRLKDLPLNVYFLILDITDFLSTYKTLEVFLFGSYAKLIHTSKSDVDIAILYENKIDKTSINHIINKLEKTYKKPIEIHYFEKKDFYKNKNDPIIKSILKDGTRLI